MESITYDEMAALAAMQLGCPVESVRSWPAESISGGWFFAADEILGASRVLIGPDGSSMWRPSSVSEKRHELAFHEEYLD